VTLQRTDGSLREMHPRHVVLATGVSGIPSIPDIPTLQEFKGRLIHASQYQDGEVWAGKRAIVLGSGNSAHDIAQDLYSGGANVTMVQRSPTMVVDLETAQLPYALYSEGSSTDDCDLITAATPYPLARKTHQHITTMGRTRDKALLEGLTARGFRLDFGEDDTGWQFKYLTRGGGYYFNVGCSELIVDGKVKLLAHEAIGRFTADGLELKDGSGIAADLVVLATGYKGQSHVLRKLFGAEVADRVGSVWGFGEDLELRNMYTRTPQPGLWFIAGSLAQCRIYSKYLALQIKALETNTLVHSQ
jgi:cation diffusion facilitator CzcD-associated flavoprotein CzcO